MSKIIGIGTSAGGLEALKILLSRLEKPLRVPVVVVQHLSPRHESYLPSILHQHTGLLVKEVEEKTNIDSGVVYVAPPNYHVLIELDHSFTLTVEPRVSYARPSIDVTFECLADAYRQDVIGVILTGANHDGARGLKRIQDLGGYTLVQTPVTAYASEMPEAALEACQVNYVGDLEDIGDRINKLISGENYD